MQVSGASVWLHCARIAGGTVVVAVMVGGVMKGGFLKSNISIGGAALASRPVIAGSPKRASMKRVREVWSWTTCEAKCLRA